MSYVFDASSIYILIKRGMMSALRGNFTTKLAEFEPDNASERTWPPSAYSRQFYSTSGFGYTSKNLFMVESTVSPIPSVQGAYVRERGI